MTLTTVRLEQRATAGGTVATLTLTSKLGSMGPAFWREMPQALAALGDAQVLILRGEEAFSAGLDVKAMTPELGSVLGRPEAFEAFVAQMYAVNEALAALPIPVVAAVHGWCIGAGLELIAAADVRLCSAGARFSLPEVKLGMVADLGGLSRLPLLIGQGRTATLALTGEPIDATTAERWGLVTEVLPDTDQLYARADELAERLCALPPKALEGTKRVLHSGLSHAESLRAAVRWNAEHLRPEELQAALGERKA